LAKVKPRKQQAAGPPKTPPGAPTRRGERRREALLDAARAVFLERGYAAASIDEVVLRVGGSKASVYQYFGSKEGLFGEMIALQCQQLIEGAGYTSEPAADIADSLFKLAKRVVQLFLTPERLAMHRTMIAEAARFPELAERFFEAGPKRGIALLAGFLRVQHGAGVINCPNPEWSAIHFMNLVRAYPMFRALHGMSAMPAGESLDAFLRDAIDLFLHGCGRGRKSGAAR
jgi:AcrR family transcriptional regulator